eukprot:TRINITY_DN2759_c0_g1_i1.p1 TRINITY_DN2759_c0_g1~~TRINITY_DN2759_c0_g1_i1.p1  ORF type:complete len:975 (+),score=129.66 TRINITY_DN2759_c0_g1_i1:108-3032(+)
MTDFSRRFEVLEEIVKTEQSYVNFLERLVKIFILPIRALVGTPEQVLSADDIKVLFANVEIIYQFNYELSAQLRTRMNNKRASFQLGDIFVKMTPYFKMYAEYLRNYDQSQALLLRLQGKHKDFKIFMEAQRTKHKEHMQLRDLLIMPVQRIPRYRLLLEELIKQTPASNMDYANIKEALQAIVEVADEVNKDIEEHERMNKIVAIENRLSNPPDNLVAPHRKFIREASFTRIEKHRKKEITFFLFNDVLVFGQQGNSFASAFKLGSKKLKVKIVASLHAVSVLDIPESDDLNGHFFQLCISPQRKMLYFQSKTVEEKASWIVSLVETIGDYNNKMNERMDNIQRADSSTPIELLKSDSESNTPLNSPGPASPNVPPNNSNSNNSSPKSSRKSGSHKKKRTSGSHKDKDKVKDKDKSDRPPSVNEESVSESSAEGKGQTSTTSGAMSVTLKPPVKDEDDEAGLLFEKLSLRASVMVNPADLHKFVQRENMKAGLKRPYETLRPTSPNSRSTGVPDRRMPSPSLAPNPALYNSNNNNNTNSTSPTAESPRNAANSVATPPPPMARMASKPNLKSPPLSPNHPTEDQTSPSIPKRPSDPALHEGQITKKASDPSLNTGQITKKASDPSLNTGQITKKSSDPALNTSHVNKDGGDVSPTPMPRPTPPTTPRGTSGGTLRKQPSIPDVASQITNHNSASETSPSQPRPTPPTTPRGNNGTLRKQPSVAEMNANQVNSPNATNTAPTPVPRRPSDASRNSMLRSQPSSGDLNANNQISSPNGSNPTSPTPVPRRPSDPKINANQIVSGPNSSPTPAPRLSDATKPQLNLNGLKSSPTSSTNGSPESSKTSSPRDGPTSGPQSAPPHNKRISAPEAHRHDVNPGSPRDSTGEKPPVVTRPAAAGTRHALEKPVAPAPNAKGLAAPPKKRPMAVSGGPSPNSPGQQKQPPMLRNPSVGQLNGPKLPPRPGVKKVSATSLDK